MQVKEVATQEVATLKQTDSLDALVQAVEAGPQDVFPVLDDNGRVVGTVGELDLVRVLAPSVRTFPFGPRKLIREGLVADVDDVMTPYPATVRADAPVQDALKRMQDLGLPQLVVVDENNKLAGLVRGRDLYCALFKRSVPGETDE